MFGKLFATKDPFGASKLPKYWKAKKSHKPLRRHPMRTSKKLRQALGIFLLALIVLLSPSPAHADEGCGQDFCLINPGGIPDQWTFTASYDDASWLVEKGLTGFHLAQDFMSPNGQYEPFPVVAVASGTISRLETANAGSGGVIDITLDSHPEVVVEYCHLNGDSINTLNLGQTVIQGQDLGIADGSGDLSGGPHLHLSLTVDGVPVDPMVYMGANSVSLTRTTGGTTLRENIKRIFSPFPWGKILWIVGIGLAALILRSWGLGYRAQLGLAGAILLVWAWVSPTNTTWLKSPFGSDVAAKVIDLYGDVRRVATGQTAQIYSIPPGTEVKSVAPGTVVEAPDLFSAMGNQVWLKVGNGLYVQYASLSQVLVTPGQKIGTGEAVGISTEQFRLGVSSKAPDLFYYPDDRSFGWVNPEKYLGQTLMSGNRQEESNAMQWGVILLVVALLWPSGYLRRLVKKLQLDLADPYGSSWFYARARLLVAATATMAVGLLVGSPWLKWMAVGPLAVSVIYFLDRRSVRKKIRNRRRINLWWPFMIHTTLSTVWFVWVATIAIGGLVDPTLTYAKNVEYQLDLPAVVTPPLPGGNGSSKTVVSSDLPEFQITYWNGSETRFWIDPDVWEAAVAAWKKYPSCDPRLSVVVAHSESPAYTNHAEENYATAAGIWQITRPTWAILWKGSEEVPERTNNFASADAFCRYIIGNGMAESINTSDVAFIRDFAEEAPVWNAYPPQALYVYRAYHELVKQMPVIVEPST